MLSIILAALGWLVAWILSIAALFLVFFLVAFAVAKLRQKCGKHEGSTGDKEDLP